MNENGALVGHNTDGVGWSRALREAFGRGPETLRILLLGAGGAGRGIATQALLEKCPELVIANRNRTRALDLSRQLREGGFPEANLRVVDWNDRELGAALRETDLVVNATAAGLKPDEPAVLAAPLLPKEVLVFDTLYGDGARKLQLEAEAAGARWTDGLACSSTRARPPFPSGRPGGAGGSHARGAAERIFRFAPVKSCRHRFAHGPFLHARPGHRHLGLRRGRLRRLVPERLRLSHSAQPLHRPARLPLLGLRRAHPWYHNIPIVSWLVLRGRAACCGTRIDLRYWLVELGMAFLFLALWLHYPPVDAAIYAFMVSGLTAACLIDLDYYIIPTASPSAAASRASPPARSIRS